ncbi:MAG: M56 family metallopeptidase, partial [Chthoniobacterales bacterium]
MNTHFPSELITWQVIGSSAVVIAAAISLFIPRLSAAYRHFFWLMSLVTVCLAGAFVVVALRVDLPVLPAISSAPSSVDSRPLAISEMPRMENASPSAEVKQTTSARSASPAFYTHWNLWLLLWGSGSLVIAGAVLLGHLRMHSCLKRGIRNPEFLIRIHSLVTQCNLRKSVDFLISETASSPFCYGLFRPIIVFPAAAITWTDEQLLDCLRHEGAHLLRGDLVAMAGGHCAIIACWFNPLIWFAAARMRAAAEQACDDLVIASREPQRYATSLVDLAAACSGHRNPGMGVTMPMFRDSSLKSRLHHLFGKNQSRRAVSLRMAMGLFILTALVILASTSIHLVAAPVKQSVKIIPPTSSSLPILAEGEIRIQVIDEQKRPISGADVKLYYKEKNVSRGPDKSWKTNQDGFTIASTYTNDDINFVGVSAPGYAPAAVYFNINDPQPVVLEKGTRLIVHAVSNTDGKSIHPYAYGFSEMPEFAILSWERKNDGYSLETNLPKGKFTVSAANPDSANPGFSKPQVIETSGTGEQVVDFKVEPPVKVV